MLVTILKIESMNNRNIIKIVSIALLFSCGTNNNTDETKQHTETLTKDSSILVKTPNTSADTVTNIVTTPRQNKDTIIIVPSFNERDIAINDYLTNQLKPIRENFKKLNSVRDWTTIDKRKLERKSENGSGEYYYLQDKLQKIIAYYPQSITNRLTEYYLLNGKLSMVVEKGIEFQDDFPELTINKSYFINNKLINKIESQDCGAPFATDYLEEEEKRITDNYKYLIKRLNRE
jgi:hypothetical protein